MKLARLGHEGRIWWGSVDGDSAKLLWEGADENIFGRSRDDLAEAVARSRDFVALADVTLLNPVPRPSKIVCIGLNYRDHAIESNLAIPAVPMVFAKFPSSLIGPEEVIVLPSSSKAVDWESELAIVVSGHSRGLPADRALEAVFGYTIANDISARDLQVADVQVVRAKSFDTFCPVGPWITTVDDLGPASNLGIGLAVNSTTMQESNTSEMIFDVPAIIAYCSAVATLNPGDLILTGTPHGTGYGLNPQVWLKPGDRVTAWVEGIGSLSNPVVDEHPALVAR